MNKRLIIHSDHIPWKTQVDEKFLELCWKKPEDIKMAYIPSQSDADGTRKYFNQKVSWYSQFWIQPENISYFDVDREYDPSKEWDLFSNDAIFLSWWNTFHFLNNLRQRWFIEKLRKFVEEWWILIWASAGWILMSETIWTAGWWLWLSPDDESPIWLTDLSSLCLNEFDFFPHFVWDEETIKKLTEYSKWKLLYAVKDWDGIVVNWDNVETIWDVIVFQNWEKK